MSASNLRDRVIAWARSQVGTRETGRNKVKYWALTKPSYQGQPWCGAFVTAAWLSVGIDLRPFVNPYYVPALVAWAKKIGAWKTSNPKPADLVCYTFGKKGRFPHVGLAWPDPAASGRRAIEGNTSKGSAGSQANGGGVWIRYRGAASIGGWIDMDKVLAYYKLTGAAADAAKDAVEAGVDAASGKLDEDGRFGEDTARELQERLRTRDLDLKVDGKFGPASFRALQAFLRAPYIDGEISRQPNGAKDLGNGYRKDVIHVGDGDSPFVRHWQAYVGAKVDGRLGEDTIRRTQIQLNASEASFTADHDTTVDLRLTRAGLL